MEETILEVRGLSVGFFTRKEEVKAVRDVSLRVSAGKIVGIVGESGCGKSLTARAVMGLLPAGGRVTAGEALLAGRDILRIPEKEKRRLRGSEMSMIFQEPMTSLNPVMKIGRQVEEAVLLHESADRRTARRRAVEMLEAVGIPEAEKRASAYPHQLSGGLRQRVMIAMAMVCRPRLLIADEPTTALDVTVEAQILRLMKSLCAQGTSILFISHNLGVIAQICDTVYVMYAGSVVEEADTAALFDDPRHPYTKGLLGAVLSLDRGEETLATIPGTVPNLRELTEGCPFAPRCALCGEKCGDRMPGFPEVAPGHRVRCFRTGEGEER